MIRLRFIKMKLNEMLEVCRFVFTKLKGKTVSIDGHDSLANNVNAREENDADMISCLACCV